MNYNSCYKSNNLKDIIHQLHPDANSLRFLFTGDVLGRPGRKIFKSCLSKLSSTIDLSFVSVNGENIAGGFGITTKIFQELIGVGVNCFTMGNHWSEKKDVHTITACDSRLVLPLNIPNYSGQIFPEFSVKNTSKKVIILNFLGLFGMHDNSQDPFELLQKYYLDLRAKRESQQYIIFCDFHAEATSEKQAMLWYMDGIYHGLFGTHTHVPTADERITDKGTAFISDMGMTGPYKSIIGMNIEKTLRRYTLPKEKKPQEVATDDLWFNGVLVEIEQTSTKTLAIHRIQYREIDDNWLVSSFHS